MPGEDGYAFIKRLRAAGYRWVGRVETPEALAAAPLQLRWRKASASPCFIVTPVV